MWNDTSLFQPRTNSGFAYSCVSWEAPSTDSDSTIECCGKEVSRACRIFFLLGILSFADCTEIEDSFVWPFDIIFLFEDMKIKPPTTRLALEDSYVRTLIVGLASE